MNKKNPSRFLAVFLIISILLMTLSGCGIESKHAEMSYEENDNEEISVWDDVDNDNETSWENAQVVTWEDIDEYSDWVYSELVFDDITTEMPVIECRVLDYRDNGKYFDGEQVYKLVGDNFDVNSFVAKYAVGTGVILICVVLNVATAGASTPVTCFIAGAADASVSMAVKGAAFGAATKAIVTAIKSGGDIEETLYGALEGSADGYMWGAIYGAATGGFKSKYCFTEDTPVLTENGMVAISSICTGDMVYSYDEKTGLYGYREVTQASEGNAEEIISVTAGGGTVRCTGSHPFYTDSGWKPAKELSAGDKVLSDRGAYIAVESVEVTNCPAPVTTYTLCVDDYHSFMVGEARLVVHNNCKPNEKYANDTYKFPEGSEQAAKYPNGVPFDANGDPDFSQYASKTVKFDYPSLEGKSAGKCLTGNCTSDFRMANKAAGFGNSANSHPAGYTWHHNQDMQTMQLVPQDVHSVAFGGVAHAGGESALKEFWALLEAVAS